ncbi:hypothetical protein PC129_g16628 [Phytophthora cactorum]|uniref:Uncharacterized protein n=1 Tax=Phytophthora cactorum TaxID=29920 RepID=A0A8T1K9W0_9STRA|nr:hypothetical protein Pcac1_g7688 [Phytophthora cactorum]KAG2884188.1 hypothetical protein PC114_g20241 [Phytophthora cactorum]KAG2898954.1 hypothetical protein PC117_g22402 [Phytophthora cactorum]KAG2976535.1 hypothetical protein PC119_g22162 [Phytophthora cactorum]KAG3003772.1 hypothetical protein PC120_g18963 [Phytophthora cactorum]
MSKEKEETRRYPGAIARGLIPMVGQTLESRLDPAH